MGVVVPTWISHLWLVKVHSHQPLYHSSNAALNRTFNVSQIPPLASVGVHQDAAVIAVEVSAATAAQASKEFQCMWEPKNQA